MTRWNAGLAAALAALACGPTGAEPPRAERPAFDGERAFADLVDLVQIGPRPSGSEGAARARELISSRLRQAGWRVEEQEFSAGPAGVDPLDMVNVVGLRDGPRTRRILLGTHYDTKRIPGIRFVGANDGASGVAVLLELARQLSTRELEYGISLIFFDGEEALGPSIHSGDGLFGSRWLAGKMAREGTLGSIAAFVLVDMVGDKDLNLAVDLSSSPRLRRLLREAAARLDMSSIVDSAQTLSVIDDHTPFLERGVSNTLALIDFQFGTRRSPGPLWHTQRDDLPAVSRESLNRVGRLLVELLQGVEQDLLAASGAG